MKRVDVLRKTSHVSAVILALHVAILAVYLSAGMVLGILAPQFFETFGKTLVILGIITLAVFCLSTQYYRDLKKQNGS